MLFLALTRSGLLELLPSRFARQFSVAPDWFLTVVHDDFLSRLSESEDEINATESLMVPVENRDLDVVFVTARFLRNAKSLQISKSSGSGRPVYHCVNSRGEFFLSTDIALLRRAGVRIEEDSEVLGELLFHRAIAPPRTFYRGIRQLWLAGSLAVQVKQESLQVEVSPVGYQPPSSYSGQPDGDPVERVANLLNGSVGKLRPLASRVATLLSGGVDSSILGAIARDQLAACDTYSTCYPFDNPATNGEQSYALSAASWLSTRHTLFTPTPTDFVAGFVGALADAEAPLDHLQSVLLHLLFKEGILDRRDRIICGEAADSVFGLPCQFMLRQGPDLRTRFCLFPPVRNSLRALSPHWAKARGMCAMMALFTGKARPLSDPLNPVWSQYNYGDFEWIRTHYRASREEIMASRSTQLGQGANRSFNDMLSVYAINTEVTGTMAVWSKLAEGQRKILYYPFASQDVLDCAFSIPWETKLKSEKHVLREAATKLGVPASILNRPKLSFGIMSDRWAVKGGALEPLIPVAAKVVDLKQLRSLQGTEPRKAMTLWAMLNFAVLKRLFVLGESRQALMDEVLDNCERQKHDPVFSQAAPVAPSLAITDRPS